MHRIPGALLIVLFTLLLGACSGLLKSDRPTKQIFLLQPLSTSSSGSWFGDPMPLAISVRVVPGLDTDRILVLGTNSSLTPVANAHWADHLPEVMASIVRRSLTLNGRYAPGFDDRKKASDTSRLQLELQAFYGLGNSIGEPDQVEITMEGWLICMDAQHSFQIEWTETISTPSLSRIVAAHQTVLDEAMEALLQVLDKHCRQGS